MKKYEGEGLVPVITIEPEVARTAFLITGCTTYDYSGDADIVLPGNAVIVIGDDPEPLAGVFRANGVKVEIVPVAVEKMFARRDDFRTLIRGLAGIVEEPERIGLGDKEKWMRDLVMSDLSYRAIVVGIRIILFMNMQGKQRCNPSLKTIAMAVGLSTTTVKKAIKELVETGWLERESGGILKGGTANNYRPTFPPVVTPGVSDRGTPGVH